MYVRRPEGEPKETDFALKEEELPALEAEGMRKRGLLPLRSQLNLPDASF